MISVVSIIVIGFILGMRHATDPDHVIAVTTIVSRERSVVKAGLIGVLWGLGHTFTVFFVGAAIILFNVAIPPRLGLTMELSVGVMLVLLGCLNLTGVFHRFQGNFLSGTTQSVTDERARTSQQEPLGLGLDPQIADSSWSIYQTLRPIVVGIVHGLAGSAAIALLLMATIRNPWWAMAYLLIFGLGTVAGMMLITAIIALPFRYTASRFAWLNRGMTTASGIISICFGVFLAYQIGFVDGLFTGNFHWIPR